MKHKAVNFIGLNLCKGYTEELAITKDCRLEYKGNKTAVYIAPVFDTGEQDCTFGRLTIDAKLDGIQLECIVAASDSSEALIDGAVCEIGDYLHDTGISLENKAALLSALPGSVNRKAAEDILLQGVRGRYVYICLILHPMGECGGTIEGLQLILPFIPFTEYFPEVYHGNNFFDRFVSVFQSMYMDTEQRVDDIVRFLDIRTTPDTYVSELAGWLGLDSFGGLFSPESLRYIAMHIDLFQGAKGTKKALEEIIKLATGVCPLIIEHFEWLNPRYSVTSQNTYRRLYGETAGSFCVILNLCESEMSVSNKTIERLIEAYCPMDARFKIVILRKNNHLDTHCYLDVNSALSAPKTAGIGDGEIGGHIILG